jgi:trk system potassium uptake protein TrkA
VYIIIVGCGRIGSMLASDLSNEGNDVVIIDQECSKLDFLGSGFNGIRSVGVEFDNDVLIEAGISRADVFFAMTSNDNINLVAAQIASKVFGVKRVISRVNDPAKQFLYDQQGIESICPTSLTVIMGKAMIEPHKKIKSVSAAKALRS